MLNNNNYIYINTLIISIRVLLTWTIFTIPFYSIAQNQNDIQLAQEYLLKGEKRKALELYRDLIKSEANVPFIQNSYLNTLIDLGESDEALSFLKKLQKREPENLLYKADVGLVYIRMGDMARADKYFKDLINDNKTNVNRIKILSDYLASRSLSEYSIIALSESRSALGNPTLFCLELAMLYRIQGLRDKMVQEYLTYVTQTSANLQYVKNVMQALLTKPDELESLENVLYDRVQKYPDVEVYSDLLIWVSMQQKNFYGAFVQARAYDRRYQKLGEKTIEVARVAADNDDYETAIAAYNYVKKQYPAGPFYLQSQLGLIRAQEARIKNTYPVRTDSVANLIKGYDNFISQYPDNPNALEAQRSEAVLYATYLDEKEKAIELLTKLIANPRANLQLKSKAKLDLGDIYLLKGEPWESTLLFSQVEKALVENPVGYEAKLKNAKLSYYKGDFKLAQEHLDILKQATTREIANDAMDLSMRIKENIAVDSSGEALKAYASIELKLYQHKEQEALTEIKLLKEGTVKVLTAMAVDQGIQTPDVIKAVAEKKDSVTIAISNHFILDDVYWLEANLRMQRGEFDQSVKLLQQILDEYGNDVLADDAYFLQGEMYERHIKNKEKAMEIYRDFLTRYPGSVYAAEARKRFRMLRGDFTEHPEQVIPQFNN